VLVALQVLALAAWILVLLIAATVLGAWPISINQVWTRAGVRLSARLRP
jgi:hypothetical protein